MHINHIFVPAIILGVFSPLFVWAIDTHSSDRIINNFKSEEYTLLFETLPFDQSGSEDLLEYEYKMNGLEGLKKKLNTLSDVYSKEKDKVTDQRITLEMILSRLDNSIVQTEKTISDAETTIQEKSRQIQMYHYRTLQLKQKIQSNRATISTYLVSIHAESSLLYNETFSIDMMQGLLLSDTTTDGIVSDITYKSLISLLGEKFLDEYKALIKEYYRISLKEKEEVASMTDLQTVLERQKSNLLLQKSEREKLLLVTQGQEALFQKYLESQKRAGESVEKSWEEAQRAYNETLEIILQKNGCNKRIKLKREMEKCGMIDQYYKNERTLRQTEVQTGTVNIMQWPIESKNITAFFRDSAYFAFLGSQHDAIDIATDQGTDVRAAMDGYILYVLPPKDGGYSYLAIKHPAGYVTVYGHLSEIDVTPYQYVTQGQVIAKSGGMPGTPGAGPMTSGAHLHLEVWKDQKPLDPLRVLSLAHIAYETLPSRYQEKFISDMVETYGSGAGIDKYEVKFQLKGNDEESRQKYLLKTYASQDFQDWDMWVDVALENHVDPSFLMCVGLAETTLGNRLKTPYNIGNVGNTDSGDVYNFQSSYEGLEWMGKTFNNKFLSQYIHLSDLSRWGNESGPIYASSSANWHNNIVRCLSTLKGRFVEDDYLFRIQ